MEAKVEIDPFRLSNSPCMHQNMIGAAKTAQSHMNYFSLFVFGITDIADIIVTIRSIWKRLAVLNMTADIFMWEEKREEKEKESVCVCVWVGGWGVGGRLY